MKRPILMVLLVIGLGWILGLALDWAIPVGYVGGGLVR